MADIKFSCPHCNQHITCDELWGGHELQCPGCQGKIAVPAVAGSTPEAAPTNPLVPAPPKGGASKLAKRGPQSSPAEGPAPAAAPKAIPIRNLAPAAKKKQSPAVKIAVGAAVTVLLAAGGYFGFVWISDYQAKAKAKSAEAEKNADGGQVGHIAELNTVMDATDPSKGSADAGTPRRRARSSEAGQAAPPADGSAGTAPGAAPADNLPIIPPAYTLDVAVAKIPESKANGSLSGTNFVVESARIDPVGTAQVLRLMQGPTTSPDREVLVYLHLKAGEKLGGQTLAISQDMRGLGVPQVTKRWKINPKFAPSLRSFSTGYAMKLELGQLAENSITGKIYLSLPDNERSVVAGSFKATIATIDPNAQVMPVASPTTTPSAGQSAMDARYGIRR